MINLAKIRWKSPKDWVLKILSLFFAITLWYFVVGEDKIDVTLSVPIEITNLPQDMVISNQFQRQLEVTVSGPRGTVRGLEQQHISRPVDLAMAQPGTRVIPIKPESIKLPRGVRIQRIQPANVTILIDKLLQKELPIQVTTVGEPMPGFGLAAALPDPPSISLTAPATLLADLAALSTEPIDLTDINANLSKQVTLDLNPQVARLVGEPLINVKILIKEKRVQKIIQHVPVKFSHDAERTFYQLSDNFVDIDVDVPFILAQDPNLAQAFSPEINAASLAPGRYSLTVKVSSDYPRVKVTKITPAEISLKISRPGPLLKRKPENQ